jgi:DNA invertase Pin-like site-specific DNA recombinase
MLTLQFSVKKMTKTIAYIRASTDKQDLNNQKLEIYEYAKKHQLKIDGFIEMTISSRKTTKERRIDEMLQEFNGADTLVVTELSRLGPDVSSQKLGKRRRS